MKTTVQAISKFLIAYFLTLPMLFGIHSSQHLHTDVEHQPDVLEISESADCVMCDMYSSQSAVEVTTIASDIKLAYLYLGPPRSKDLIKITIYSNNLRGPPII